MNQRNGERAEGPGTYGERADKNCRMHHDDNGSCGVTRKMVSGTSIENRLCVDNVSGSICESVEGIHEELEWNCQ